MRGRFCLSTDRLPGRSAQGAQVSGPAVRRPARVAGPLLLYVVARQAGGHYYVSLRAANRACGSEPGPTPATVDDWWDRGRVLMSLVSGGSSAGVSRASAQIPAILDECYPRAV